MRLWINGKLVGMVSPPDNTSSFSIRGIFGFFLRRIMKRLSPNTYPTFVNHNNNHMENSRAE